MEHQWSREDLADVAALMRRDGHGARWEGAVGDSDPRQAWSVASEWAHQALQDDRSAERAQRLDDLYFAEPADLVRRVLDELGFEAMTAPTTLWPAGTTANTGAHIDAADDRTHREDLQITFLTSVDGLLAEMVEDPYFGGATARVYFTAAVPTAMTRELTQNEAGRIFHAANRNQLAAAIELLFVTAPSMRSPISRGGLEDLQDGGPNGSCLRYHHGILDDQLLRTRVTVLRACARVITPWPIPVVDNFGGKAAYRDGHRAAHRNTLRLLARLPEPVRQRFGTITAPALPTRSPSVPEGRPVTPAAPNPVVLAAAAPDGARLCDQKCLLRGAGRSVLLTETWWVTATLADDQDATLLCYDHPHRVQCPQCGAHQGITLRLLPGAEEVTARCPTGHTYHTDVPVQAFMLLNPAPEPPGP